ncbi:MAG: DNA polymerase III subunit chi [Burkholderiales bacterium]|nr:MAG: DNA polymerase III subunit chi [Burkholderiales bacterium]
MTEVAFHFNAPDKVSYACRLLRKAVGNGAKVVVTGEGGLLRELDTALWTFSALEFLPHCMGTGDAALLAASPIVLVEGAHGVPHQQVLVNLGARVPDGFERFERLIEVVAQNDEADRLGARNRWKHYADRGYSITRHDLAPKAAA